MTITPCASTVRGFTLVELLMAMTISAFIAVAAYGGINSAITASESMQQRVEQLLAVQKALGIIEQDIQHFTPRNITNVYGSQEPMLAGGLFQDKLLTFTRAGYANPRHLPRSELLRISYQLRGETLVRQQWTVLDQVEEETGLQETVLLNNVQDVELGFLQTLNTTVAGSNTIDFELQNPVWVDDWRTQQVLDSQSQPLPLALRLTFTISGFGKIERHFELTGS